MKKGMKIALIIVIVIVVIALAIIIPNILRDPEAGPIIGGPIQVMDGDGMVYEWTNYELHGDWIEIDPIDPQHPIKMTFTDDTLKFTGWDDKETTYKYAFPDDTETYGKPDGEVYLHPKDFPEFDDLIFHEEDMGEYKLIPIISGTIFEYDGRGEIVLAEFARTDDVNDLPEDFRSSTYTKRNDREAIPTYMIVEQPATDN